MHRATLQDGTDVACKLQYPDMPSTVEADLRQLKLAMAVYQRMDNAIQQDEIYKELRERLREELDYEREAAQMRLYGLMLKDQPGVHVPVPIAGFSTKRLLTMTWLDGRPLMQRLAEDPPQEERNRIAKALFRAWYVPFYRYGVIHGDPHLGNYQVRPDGTVNLLDFGAIRVFPARSSSRGVIELFEAVRDNDDDKAQARIRELGLRGPVAGEDGCAEHVGAVPVRAADAGPRAAHPGDGRSDIRPRGGRTGACRPEAHRRGDAAARVRADGPFAIGLGGVFLRLKAELNWSRLFHELIADFNEAALAERQAAALAEAGVPVVG